MPRITRNTLLPLFAALLLALPLAPAQATPLANDIATAAEEKKEKPTVQEILDKAWAAGDYATIALYTLPMAKRGHAKSQYTMGRLYFSGYGVKQDYSQAIQWMQKSSAQGYAPAQTYLAGLCSRRPALCR